VDDGDEAEHVRQVERLALLACAALAGMGCKPEHRAKNRDGESDQQREGRENADLWGHLQALSAPLAGERLGDGQRVR